MADKVKRNQFTLLLENNVCQGLKILKLGCELKFISPRHKISYRYFNYIMKMNGLRKNIHILKKMLVLPSLFSKLLNHNYRPK